MKLAVSSIKFPHKVVISPDASWLQMIARDLCPADPQSTQIRGQLSLNLDSGGFVFVTGHISAQATLPCDRCGEDVKIPIETDIAATFRPPYEANIPREISLSAEDLEVYFIDGGVVDLETVINDSLQCALPNHLTCENSHGKPCSNDDDGLVYRDSREFEVQSPFAVLKNLKKS